jgi:FkbM family methyltransferase
MKQKIIMLLIVANVYVWSCNATQLAKNVIASLLPKNAIIVDAGAYDGNDTKEWSALLPDATIIACEPVPSIFQRLRSNTMQCKNVICLQKALSNSIGYQTMYISQGTHNRIGDQSSSLLAPEPELNYYFPHIIFPQQITVESLTLDKLAEDLQIDHIDFLWFDLQGMEQFVLEASPKMFATVQVIFTEVSYCKLYEKTPLYPEFKAWMEQQGFVALSEIPEHPTFGDTLFVRKELMLNLRK